jgi:hypothetical protein
MVIDVTDWLTRYIVRTADSDMKPIAAARGYAIGPVYHATQYLFDEFSDTKDIGYHFGTKGAALDRSKGKWDVETEENLPTAVEYDCLALENGTLPIAGDKDRLYAVLIKKLDNPSRDYITRELDRMEADEVAAAIDEYSDKPDSLFFKARVERAMKGVIYDVETGGMKKSFDSKEKAERYIAGLSRAHGPGAYYLAISNPMEIEDLGVWPALEIAKECGFSPKEINQVMEAGDKYAEIVSLLDSKGYDGMIYENAVEDPGSYSYIAFHPWQAKLADATTFDDELNPIPVDARFDRTSSDVRY